MSGERAAPNRNHWHKQCCADVEFLIQTFMGSKAMRRAKMRIGPRQSSRLPMPPLIEAPPIRHAEHLSLAGDTMVRAMNKVTGSELGRKGTAIAEK